MYCESNTYEDAVNAALWKGTRLVVVENIPAHVCEECGEQFYDEEITRALQGALNDQALHPTRQVSVPVFSFAAVELHDGEKTSRAAVEIETEAPASLHNGVEPVSEEMEREEDSDTHLCEQCGLATAESIVTATFWGERGLVVIENVPARVCQRCEAQFYDDDTTQRIARLTQQVFPRPKPERMITVPVFSMVRRDPPPGL